MINKRQKLLALDRVFETTHPFALYEPALLPQHPLYALTFVTKGEIDHYAREFAKDKKKRYQNTMLGVQELVLDFVKYVIKEEGLS